MYDDPALIVLDEPNSNLDEIGEQALVTAVLELRKRGKTIVLITHRPSILGATTKLLVMKDGSVQAFGPTQQVMTAIQDANKKAVEAAQQRAAEQGAEKPRAPRYGVPERIATDPATTPPAATSPTTAPAAPAAPAATAAPAPGEIN
jgi:ATP-binding cassette subfamily C exporter for protease/lipase